MTIGANAKVTGNVNAEQVSVQGEAHGTIRARSIHLSRSAKVTGDIFWHEMLSVETGAFYEGQCKHTDKPRELSEHAFLPETAHPLLQKASVS